MKIVLRNKLPSWESSSRQSWFADLLERYGTDPISVLGLSTWGEQPVVLIAQSGDGWGLRFCPLSFFRIIDGSVSTTWKLFELRDVEGGHPFFLGLPGLEDGKFLEAVMDCSDPDATQKFSEIVSDVEFGNGR